MRVRQTKVIQKITLLKYNVGVQAALYMQKKGDFIWQQRHRVLRTQNSYAKYHIVFVHLSIDVKLCIINIEIVYVKILRRLCEYKGVKIIEGSSWQIMCIC